MVKNRNWKCPICQKDAKSFFLDKQIQQLIKKSDYSSTIPSKITFLKDGRILLKMSSEHDATERIPDEEEELKTKKIKKKPRKNKMIF